MPNWCSNSLYVTGPTQVIKDMAAAAEKGELLQFVCPVPQELTDTVSGSFGDTEKQAALEAKQSANVEKYGYATWYDFCVNEWGTKWDIGGEDCHMEVTDVGDGSGNSTLKISFDSAWAPPIAAYEKMEGLGLEVRAFYYEPGMAFCGQFFEGEDAYWNITGNSDWVSENIPDEIDTEMNISESMAEWETDEETDEA
jgi:hypothetical protein